MELMEVLPLEKLSYTMHDNIKDFIETGLNVLPPT